MAMISKHRTFGLALCLTVLSGMPVRAQTVAATILAGSSPQAVAVNTVTNKIYVANYASGNVTIIDPSSNSTTTVQAGLHPVAVAVNEATDKIYVANHGDALQFGGDPGSITVVDGASGSTTTVIDPNAVVPTAVAVNSVTNKIYVANFLSSNITVMDGDTNVTTTVTDPNAAGLTVYAVAINETTNKIYFANNDIDRLSSNPGNITVIDGATNSTTTVTDPNAITPVAVAVNPATDKIYVANEGAYPAANHGNVTIIDGSTNGTTTVTDPNALAPLAVAVNQSTNKIYVANTNDSALTGIGGVTVIDGTTNSISALSDPNASFPNAVAIDSATNIIYVANQGCFADDPCTNPGSVSVIDATTNSVATIIDPKAKNPTGLAVDPTTDNVYVPNASSGNVTVINGAAVAESHNLLVLLAGNGNGTVTSSPAGIACGTSCGASFATGTAINLTASPASGSDFSGWSIGCTGTGPCNVMMTSDEFVTATFNTGPARDFSVIPASASLTAQRGAPVTDVITIAPLNGPFSNTVQLSCAVTGSTPLATCSLSPGTVTPGTNDATSTLTINVPSQSAKVMPFSTAHRIGLNYAAFLPIPLSLLASGLGAAKFKRRKQQLWLLCSFLLVLVALQAGCSGGSALRPPPLNYVVTVTATSGAIQHTAQVGVTVQ